MSQDPYESRPWLARYRDGHPSDIEVSEQSMLHVVRDRAASHPDLDLLVYFDRKISYREFDEITDAFAAGLVANGFEAGDRLAVMLQNTPQFFIGTVGAWKAGGTSVSVNPMNRERELGYILNDSGAKALLCHETLYRDIASNILADTPTSIAITTSELDFQTRNDERVLGGIEKLSLDGTIDLVTLIEEYAGAQPPEANPGPDDVAVLTYTSGTTGQPKGATNTHGNVVHNSKVYQDWIELDDTDGVYAVAPLFHITGFVGHLGLALYAPLTCVLPYRFEPQSTADLIEEHKPTFTVGAITVFIALMNANVDPAKLASLQKYYSGGAPIPPSVLIAFEEAFGHYIHNAYGLTETTSPSHLVPLGTRAPVDETSGATSVGVPVFGTIVRIVGEDGQTLPVGEVGEIQSDGPGIVPAYWGKPEETAKSLPQGRLNTGDVGFMDADGWFYIVDRKKDMINASGYKVWPREVEDVLYTHSAVREAAVVGVPDSYRGESVRAYVSLKPGMSVTPEEIVAFAKEHMAAYKYPREVLVVDELPKTVTGKILRRELRDQAAAEQSEQGS